MSEKKHIDRLFQEKFKDFEAKPSANVWAGIQSKMELPQEKTKTIFPFWIRFASIAAVLILLFTVGNLAFNNNNIEENSSITVDINSKNSNTNYTKEVNTIKKNKNKSIEINNAVVVENNLDVNKKSNNSNSKVTNSTVSASNKNRKALEKNKNNRTKSIESRVLVAGKNNGSNAFKNEANKLSSQVSNTKGVSEKNNENSENKNVLNTKNNTTLYAESLSTKKTNTTILNSNTSNTTVANNKTLENSVNTNSSKSNITDNSIENNSVNNYEKNNDSNVSTVKNNNNELNKTNTKATNHIDKNNAISNTTVATTNSEKEEEKLMEPDSANSSNTIEEALAKTKDLDEEEENLNRWTVNANAAPVYYNTLGKGSHIHDQFIDNPKNGEINTSYGINVGYALNGKLKVRTGLNKLNLSYDTANVIIYENVTSASNSSPLRNINFVPTNEGQNISALSSNSLSIQQIDGFINDQLNAALSQRISYLEVPLELEYTVVKKRFGVNLIGGFSTFILNDNEVVTEVDNRKTKIGEANNINNLSFSANAGLGINYKFNKSLKFNLEPTFKYQINAYSETSGDFRPYIIGVYTGFSYKF